MTHRAIQALDRRRRRLIERLDALGLDALIVSHGPNVRYLTGFAGSASLVVAGPRGYHLLTDSRYLVAAEGLLAEQGDPVVTLVPVERSYEETLADHLAAGPGRIGFEGDRVPVNLAARWAAMLSAPLAGTGPAATPAGGPRLLVPTSGVVEEARAVKDPVELATLREAARRISQVATEVIGDLEAGPSEREVAALIDARVREAGLDGPIFDTIVASGPASALPHATPGDRVLEPGDLVLIDFGGAFGGYCADLTRTVVLGEPDRECRRLHAAVRAALEAAEAAAVEGRLAGDVDSAARQELARHAPDGVYGHGTGHGLGLEVHEAPRIGRPRASGGSQPADSVLVAGLVFTLEPGFYRAGWGGIRIEDDYALTAGGLERLTSVPRGLNLD